MKKLLSLALLSALIFLIPACGCTKQLTEEERYIEASTEISCETIKDPSLSTDLIKSKELSSKIFKEYDFPVDNNETMLGIMDKYEKNEEVAKKITEKVETECK
jgi:predicted component of type VI protein secretion system